MTVPARTIGGVLTALSLAVAISLAGGVQAQAPSDNDASGAAASDDSVAGAAFSAAASSPPFSCGQDAGSVAQVLAQRNLAPGGFVVPSSSVSPRNGALAFTYLQPAGRPDDGLRFRVFLNDPAAAGSEKAVELSVLSVAHPLTDATLPAAAQAVGANAQNAYLVRAQTPKHVGGVLDHRQTLVVLACEAPTSGAVGRSAAPVGYAQTPVEISNGVTDGCIAFVIMALVYLLAGLIRWQASVVSRGRAATLADRFGPRGRERAAARLSRRGAQYDFANYFNPVVMSADIFNRASLSQLQILGFLLLVGYGVAYSLLRTGTLSDLSASIVYLLGIPAVGALGSHVATTSQDRFSTENWSWLVSRHVLSIDDPGVDKPKWRDVLMTGSQIDLYKLQAFTFSIIVALAMIYSGFTSLQTFTVPATLLQIMGLSQVVFVGGRFTSPASVADADKLVTELRQRASDLRVAVSTGIDVDSSGAPQRPSDGGAPPVVAATLADARKVVPNAVARYLETADELEILLKGLTYRDVVTDALLDPFRWDAPPLAPPKKTPPGPPPMAPTVVGPGAGG